MPELRRTLLTRRAAENGELCHGINRLSRYLVISDLKGDAAEDAVRLRGHFSRAQSALHP